MRYLVYGSRELGRVVRSLLRVCDLDFAGFIDDVHEGPEILGPFDLIQGRVPPEEHFVVNAVGYSSLDARARLTESIRSAGYSTPSLIHPAASIAPEALIGPGAVVMAQAVIDTGAALGEMVVVWPGAVVNHDAKVGDNTFLSPNCTICGGATIGANCFIGAGAVVVDHRTIPRGSFVKANSTWTRRDGP